MILKYTDTKRDFDEIHRDLQENIKPKLITLDSERGSFNNF